MSAGVEGRVVREVAEILETDEARNLLETAQASGSVSTDDIALALDELDLDATQIDDVYRALEDLQIDVVPVAAKTFSISGRAILVKQVTTAGSNCMPLASFNRRIASSKGRPTSRRWSSEVRTWLESSPATPAT